MTVLKVNTLIPQMSLERSLVMAGVIIMVVLLMLPSIAFADGHTDDNTITTQGAHNTHNILILGDSISAAYGMDPQLGWVSLLQERITTDNDINDEQYSYKVINASVSGNTTGDGLSRLPKLLEVYQPSIVIIELGGNDGLRGYPVKLMAKNLQRMIDLSQANNAQVVLAGIEIPPNYGQRYTEAFRNTFQQVAANNTVRFIPFILQDIATDPALMQDDGIHPTAEAQTQLLDNIWNSLVFLLK